MYKSPIEIIHEQAQKIENGIFKVLHNMDINVDKNELMKALKYDRDQYNAGYADGLERGRQEMARKFVEKFKNNFRMFDEKDAISLDLIICYLESIAKHFGLEEQGND